MSASRTATILVNFSALPDRVSARQPSLEDHFLRLAEDDPLLSINKHPISNFIIEAVCQPTLFQLQ